MIRFLSLLKSTENKLPRRKQRGIKSQSQQFPSRQTAGNLPAEIKNSGKGKKGLQAWHASL